MKCPKDGEFVVRSLKTPTDFHKPEFQGIIQNVELLGHGPVQWQADEQALRVSAGALESDWPVVLKVTLQ